MDETTSNSLALSNNLPQRPKNKRIHEVDETLTASSKKLYAFEWHVSEKKQIETHEITRQKNGTNEKCYGSIFH